MLYRQTTAQILITSPRLSLTVIMLICMSMGLREALGETLMLDVSASHDSIGLRNREFKTGPVRETIKLYAILGSAR